MEKHTKIFSLPVLSMVWFVIALVVPNLIMCFSEDYGPLTWIGSVVLPFGLYTLFASFAKAPWKTWIWMLPFTFFAAFQIVLLNLYGGGPIAVDMFLNMATTNTTEVYELLSGLLPALLEVAVLYIVPLLLAIVAAKNEKTLSLRVRSFMKWWGIALTLIGVAFMVAAMLGKERANPLRQLFPVNVCANLFTAFERWDQTKHYSETSAGFRYNATPTHPADSTEVYVLVVGESSRAVNWQLAGYDRPTNPSLSKEDGLYFFPKTLSESNTTHKSVPLLLSPLNAHNFNDSVYRVKGIVEAFREAGFRTSYISAQQPNGSYIDFFMNEADNHKFVNQGAKEHVGDFQLLPELDKELARPERKKMIVLHCYGSHYNYQDRYPSSMAIFRPDGPLESDPKKREELVNAYDNSILMTDSLLSAVISRLKEVDGLTAMIYTSDHGENIYDDERQLFLHASPTTSYWQQHVPFLVWLSQRYSLCNPKASEVLVRNIPRQISSSESFFPTAVDIAGIKMSGPERFSLLNPDYSAPAPVFLDDHNVAVPLREALAHPADRRNLLMHGFSY